jgi:hypothetical protein
MAFREKGAKMQKWEFKVITTPLELDGSWSLWFP